MEEKYGMMQDQITHYINGRPVFPAIPQPLHYSMVMLEGGSTTGAGISLGSDSTMAILSTNSGVSGDGSGLHMEINSGRWPKEETLALLDIRSKLDSKFKEANLKAPLWEEVSRIMYVEHGYKRSGKKCSEKFENLYKYYKKIKEGKVGKGRQDKKHYRFFHQIDAIYGETSATNATLPSLMEEDYGEGKANNKRILGKKSWKTTITDFIEKRMNTLMENQEKWMEKMMNTIETKEKERILKDEQRRKEEMARIEMQKAYRSNELAWMQSRDSAFMEAFHKLTKNESTIETSCTEYYDDQNQVVNGWEENEITQLIQLRSSMETRFEEAGAFMESVLWEEIAFAMGGLGYNRDALICKAKWDHISFLLGNKKQKVYSNLYSDPHNYSFHQAGENFVAFNDQHNDYGNRDFMRDPGMMWNYNGKI